MIEQMERIPNLEVEPEAKFDAILVHGYWMSEPKPGDVRLALRSRLAIRAAALTYDKGKGAGKIVIDLGHLWGPDYPTEASLMAKELEEKYSVPKQSIVLRENAYSTGGEVRSMVELSKQRGWKNIADLAFSKHHLTIPRVYEEYQNESRVSFFSVEDVLRSQDDGHLTGLLDRLGSSKHEIAYGIYEGLKWLVMHRPGFSYDVMEERNRNSRKNKGKDSPLPFSFDVYKL